LCGPYSLGASFYSLQTIPDDVDDPADRSQIVNTGNPMGQGKIRLYTVELCFGQVKQIPHGSTSAISESHLILFVNHEINES
jgi:hypothetical protein